MITSQQMQFLSEILEGQPIPEDKLVYFRERLRDRLHSVILKAFQERAKKGFKQSDLAARIHKKRAQITRWFSTPSNLTLDSVSDLMVGLGMDFDPFSFTPIEKTFATQQETLRKEIKVDVFPKTAGSVIAAHDTPILNNLLDKVASILPGSVRTARMPSATHLFDISGQSSPVLITTPLPIPVLGAASKESRTIPNSTRPAEMSGFSSTFNAKRGLGQTTVVFPRQGVAGQ